MAEHHADRLASLEAAEEDRAVQLDVLAEGLASSDRRPSLRRRGGMDVGSAIARHSLYSRACRATVSTRASRMSLGARGLRWAGKLNTPLYRLSGGRIGGKVGKAPVLLLTTTGRKSGQKRTAPVVYLRDGERMVVINTNAGNAKVPAWSLNLDADPQGRGRGRQEEDPGRRPGRRGRGARRPLAPAQRPVRGLRRLRQEARPRAEGHRPRPGLLTARGAVGVSWRRGASAPRAGASAFSACCSRSGGSARG